MTGTALLTVALAGCGEVRQGVHRESTQVTTIAPAEQAGESEGLPDGWRWESFRGVEVGVPDGWKAGGSTDQLTSQWCIEKDAEQNPPVVARPGASTLVGCGIPEGGDPEADPGTLIENAGTFLGFTDYPRDPDGTRTEGDRTTVIKDGISVLVQAPVELRDRIVDTIRQADPDFNGCPATHPISGDAAMRPEPAVDVTTLTGVTNVAACKYGLVEELGHGRPTGLLSSVGVSGADAAEAIALIASAPAGGGPDSPQTCVPEVAYGGQVIVLLVDSDQGRSEIFLRYDGCDHHGFDDGVTVRTLTAESVAPFVHGANTVDSFYDQGVFKLFYPHGL